MRKAKVAMSTDEEKDEYRTRFLLMATRRKMGGMRPINEDDFDGLKLSRR